MSDSKRWTYPNPRRSARTAVLVARLTAALILAAAAVALALFVAACSSPAPAPTATPVPPTPTRTPIPDEPPAFPFPTVVIPTPSALSPPSSAPAQSGAGAAVARAANGAEVGLSLPSIANLVENVETAVASISVESVNRGMFYDFTDEGAGTGVIVRPDGYIVTNYHVIQDVLGVKAHLPNGKSYDAEIVGWDVISDLAVIKIEPDEALPVAAWGDSQDVRVGDWVVAVGNAMALKGGPTVTLGIVSALGRTVKTDRDPLYDMIQTDAAINDGNSGGPLLNLAGEVVGINAAMLRQARGIGFAISSETARPIIESLIKHGRMVRPLIGLSAQDVTPAISSRMGLGVDEGIIVTRIAGGGPAFQAGLQVGDVALKLDGVPISDMAGFLTMLWTYNIGDAVLLEYMREDKLFETTIELAEREQPTSP